MARRVSGYERKAFNVYPTPSWVTEAVCAHLPSGLYIWEPACGDGDMVEALRPHAAYVYGSDLRWGIDFLLQERQPVLPRGYESVRLNAIITNPPFGAKLGPQFVVQALALMAPVQGTVAMLLPVDFDSAKTRRHLFADCPAWDKKLVLTRRIKWFETPGVKAGPSENHAWYIWSWNRPLGPATVHYYFDPPPPQRGLTALNPPSVPLVPAVLQNFC